MNINIKATNIELTSEIHDYVLSKLDRLDKFTKDTSITGYVEIGRTTNHHKQGDIFKAEFDVNVAGERFFTLAETEDLFTAIDSAKEDLVRRITHSKDRKQTLFKRGAKSVKKMLKGISKRNPFTSKY
ncbi:ribosome-associated translation inhibitor RaiA [Candidatus Nomurabacteria bacterium]|nr:ribosome-associated translation inhibitor RaiA [Candidatus Nomurabacteria bacterium]